MYRIVLQERRIRVAIAEDNEAFRLTLRDIISYESDMEVPVLWKNGAEVLKEINEVRPDVLLLDVQMPVMTGVETVKHLQEIASRAKVIMLTMHDEEDVVLTCLRNGASGYLVKDGQAEEILRAIREVVAGRALVHPQVTQILINAAVTQNHLSKDFQTEDAKIQSAASSQEAHLSEPRLNEAWKDILTAREYDVLQELAKGKNNEQISETLHISLKTTKNHVSHILAKLNVSDRAQAVLHALRSRWIEL